MDRQLQIWHCRGLCTAMDAQSTLQHTLQAMCVAVVQYSKFEQDKQGKHKPVVTIRGFMVDQR